MVDVVIQRLLDYNAVFHFLFAKYVLLLAPTQSGEGLRGPVTPFLKVHNFTIFKNKMPKIKRRLTLNSLQSCGGTTSCGQC